MPETTTTPASPYRPLPHGRATRVLELLDSHPQEDDRLVLRMTIFDLQSVEFFTSPTSQYYVDTDGHGRYDALSYTWGSPVSTAQYAALYGPEHDVAIDLLVDHGKHTLNIGRNLYEALLQIRATTYERQLWIDSICIDQSNVAEKEEHILLMGEIYSKAQRVIVWLGRDLFDDFKHITWLHGTVLDLIEEHVARDGTPLLFGAFPDEKGVTIYILNYVIPDEPLKALYRFYDTRRYFSRAWIRQEVALAHRCIVLLGDSQFGIERFGVLVRHFGTLSGLAMQYLHVPESSRGGEVETLARTIQQIRSWQQNGVADALNHFYGAHDGKTMALALLEYYLDGASRRLATDPRDHIYSLLGLVKAVLPIDIKPDYASPVEVVFTAFTSQQLRSLPHRTVLSLVATKPRHSDYVQRLPSWVPDLARDVSERGTLAIRLLSFGMTELNACLDGPEDLSIDGHELKLYARQCAPIDYSFRIPDSGYSPELLFRRDTITYNRLLQRILELVQRGVSDFTPLLRTICYGQLDIQDDEHFLLLWRQFLAVLVVEPRIFHNDSEEVKALLNEIMLLFDKLSDIPWIPTESFREKMDTMYTDFYHNRRRFGIEASQTTASFILQIHFAFPDRPFDRSLHERVSDLLNNGLEAEAKDIRAYIANARQLTNYVCKDLNKTISPDDTFFMTTNGYAGRATTMVEPGDELWLICQAKVPFVLRPIEGGYLLVGEAYVYGAMNGELLRNGIAREAEQITLV